MSRTHACTHARMHARTPARSHAPPHASMHASESKQKYKYGKRTRSKFNISKRMYMRAPTHATNTRTRTHKCIPDCAENTTRARTQPFDGVNLKALESRFKSTRLIFSRSICTRAVGAANVASCSTCVNKQGCEISLSLTKRHVCMCVSSHMNKQHKRTRIHAHAYTHTHMRTRIHAHAHTHTRIHAHALVCGPSGILSVIAASAVSSACVRRGGGHMDVVSPRDSKHCARCIAAPVV